MANRNKEPGRSDASDFSCIRSVVFVLVPTTDLVGFRRSFFDVQRVLFYGEKGAGSTSGREQRARREAKNERCVARYGGSSKASI